MSENKDHKEPLLPADEPQVARDKKIRSILMWGSIIIALIVLGVIVYIYAVREPGIQKANDAIAEADRIALFEGNDSTALAAYENVANNYGYDAGNRAKLQSAIILYSQGKYQEALDYLNNYKSTDHIIGATALGLKGDCLVNLDKYDDAISAFDKAIKQADGNPQLVPYFLSKKATVLAAQNKHAEAADIYAEIEKEYPDYAAQTRAEAHRLQQEALAGTAK